MNVKDFLIEYNQGKGYSIDEADLVETLLEAKTVYIGDNEEHRWYIIVPTVSEINGFFIAHTDYVITGDNSAADMDLDYDLDSAKFVVRKEREITEVYYE